LPPSDLLPVETYKNNPQNGRGQQVGKSCQRY